MIKFLGGCAIGFVFGLITTPLLPGEDRYTLPEIEARCASGWHWWTHTTVYSCTTKNFRIEQ
jgi:hypothetical protein